MRVPTPGNAAGPFASSSGQPPGSSLRQVPVAVPLSARLRPGAFNPIKHPLLQRTAPTAKLGLLCLSNDFNTSTITLFAKPSRPSQPRIFGAEDGFRSSTAPRFALLTPLLIRHSSRSSPSRSRGVAFRSFVTVRPSRMVEGPNGLDWEARCTLGLTAVRTFSPVCSNRRGHPVPVGAATSAAASARLSRHPRGVSFQISRCG